MKQQKHKVVEVIDETTGELKALILKGVTFKKGDRVVLKGGDKTEKEYGYDDIITLSIERLGRTLIKTNANLGHSPEMEEWAQMGLVFKIKSLGLRPGLYNETLGSDVTNQYSYTLAMIQHVEDVERKSEDFWKNLEVL